MKNTRKNRLKKIVRRFWEEIKSSKVIIIICCLIVMTVLMLAIMIKQQDIGAHEAGLQIEQLANTIRQHYKTRPDYWGLSTAEVLKNKLYPDSMSINGGKLLGYFNNPVEIGMNDNGDAVMPTLRDFVIAYRDLTKAQCAALAAERFQRNFWLGIKNVSIVNGDDTYTFDWDHKERTLPIERKKAADLCHTGSNIIFRFE